MRERARLYFLAGATRGDAVTAEELGRAVDITEQVQVSAHEPQLSCACIWCVPHQIGCICESCRESSAKTHTYTTTSYLTVDPPDRCFGLPREISWGDPEVIP